MNRDVSRQGDTDRFTGVLGATRGGGLKAGQADSVLVPPAIAQRFEELRELVPFSAASYDPPTLNYDSLWVVTGISNHDDGQRLLGATASEFGFDAICTAGEREDFTALWVVNLQAPADACAWPLFRNSNGTYEWNTSYTGDPSPLANVATFPRRL